MPDPTRAPLPLYEIDAELGALEAALLDAGGEITDDVEAAYHDLLDMRKENRRSAKPTWRATSR